MPAHQYVHLLDQPLVHAGKVRELYAVGEDRLLMVATDRISAFDFVLDSLIPDKGRVLTQLSQWWFGQLNDLVPNHVLGLDVPEPVRGRAVLCERLEMIPVECVARGYLTGSGWLEYTESRTVCGIALPDGLVDGSRLPEPIFTPATKAELGEHDENVDFATVAATVGQDTAEQIRALTLAVYARAEEIARGRGIILADTKLEFGRRPDGTIVLADEVLTPDSSRFWDAATWQPGGRLESYDKQYVRDWLQRESGWDRHSGEAPPPLPAEVVAATRAKYLQAYERLTGSPLPLG
jgi:phosphoribosylaminoimidazole-succinocarboxamide synthase